jgi:outer membrane receptor protein involved in Fe transport
MRILTVAIGAIATLVLFSVGSASGQGDQAGTISGIVRSSPDNLAFPGASITISSPAMQGDQTATSDESGGFVFRGVPPGVYTVRVEVAGMAPGEQTVNVLLGRESRIELSIVPAGLKETVTVKANAPPPLVETRQGINFRNEEIDALANPRSLTGIAQLAPGLSDNAPNAADGQITISGALAYDNSFLVDGVEVSDNVLGYTHNLFIEEAIEETQVLTSGIPAEYGRFSGGVVNAITKKGGNVFSGSFRVNLSNSAWSTETPFETAAGQERTGQVNPTYEATLGGRVVRDRLWFFSAWRKSDRSTNMALAQTGLPFESNVKNDRFEIKLTGAPIANHSLQGSYLRNNTESVRTAFDFSIDPRTGDTESRPNSQFVTNYRGIVTSSIFAEVQYSQKQFSLDRGGSSTSLADSPFIAGFFSGSPGHYNAPYFDETDPEDRNNQQLTGSLSYFLASDRTGRHDLKGGFEYFKTSRVGGNSQSRTDTVFFVDYKTNAAGQPVFDGSGRLIPAFVPGFTTFIDLWFPERGAKLDIKTTSLYVQDTWRPHPRWSFNLGARYEHVTSSASGGVEGVKANTIVPRLAGSFDVRGDGRLVAQATYGHYAGRYNDVQFGANTRVGNPDELFGFYTGPAGEGLNFAPGLDAANYEFFFAAFPTANVFFDEDLSSPLTREFTLSTGAQLGQRSYGKVTYVRRRVTDIVEDFITRDTGTTHIVVQGEDFGDFPNIVYRNTDLAERMYDALVFQGRYDFRPNWSMNGHWTVQLQNDGNFEGEATNRPAITSVIGNYPELFTAPRHYPDGHLDDFQRHRVRVWSTYRLGLERYGDLDISGLWRINSARTYSLAASTGLNSVQQALGAGYATLPEVQEIFFDERGSETFKGYAVIDLSVMYQIPVFKTARPWIKLELYNAFNNQKLISWNTTITPDASSPKDQLGLATGFTQGSRFGQAQGPTSFPVPFAGVTGGRTFLMAAGVRF